MHEYSGAQTSPGTEILPIPIERAGGGGRGGGGGGDLQEANGVKVASEY